LGQRCDLRSYNLEIFHGKRYPDNTKQNSKKEVFRMKKEEGLVGVPIWRKSNLTLEEAAAYTGIGICKLRELSSRESCDFVLWIGKKRLFKRKKLDAYLDKAVSI
jgi:excisionase family DNA binding protein